MISNPVRNGNFTSSEIVALTTTDRSGKSWGEPALTYIEETNFERRLRRSISDETNAKPLTWGNLCEGVCFGKLGLEYIITSQQTDVHPEINYWAGSKDGYKKDKGKTVWDIKCPMTLKSFCQLVDPLYNGLEGIAVMEAIREGYTDKHGCPHKKHKDGNKYYWQLVSNAILTGSKFAELIVFMPYKSELEEIRTAVIKSDGADIGKYYWINNAGEDELPFLLDEGYYKNLNVIRFAVPELDKKLLTEKVLAAGKMLIKL